MPSGFLPDPLADLRSEISARVDRMVTPVNEYGFDPFGFDKQAYISALSLRQEKAPALTN
jgi:hypothetical protein